MQVGGVTVSQATLHNEEDLARKDVREGDVVVVTSAGDVIPQVIAPLIQRREGKRLRKAKPPKKCPRCDTPIVKPDDSVFSICPNRRGCPGQTFQRIKHFTAVMDIEGFGEKLSYRFLDEGLIKDQADVYDITVEDLQGLEGFGEISARNLKGAIDDSKKQPYSIVLFALGLPGIGYVTAQALAEHFGTMEALLEADAEAIEEVEGVGPITAQQIAEELAEEPTRELIERLRERGLRFELDESERRAQGGPLDGKTFVITGTLPESLPRRGLRPHQARGRQGHGLGLEEDRLRRSGRQPGLEAREGGEPGRRSDRRSRAREPPLAERELSAVVRDSVRVTGTALELRLAVAGYRCGHRVLGAAGGVDRDVVHQDREGDLAGARSAVARERAHAVDRAGLADAPALSGGAAHATGQRAGLTGDRERVVERGLLGVVLAHVRQKLGDALGRRGVRAGEPGAVHEVHAASRLPARRPRSGLRRERSFRACSARLRASS